MICCQFVQGGPGSLPLYAEEWVEELLSRVFGILGNLEAPQTRSDHAAVQGNATTAPTASFLLEGNSMFRSAPGSGACFDARLLALQALCKAVPQLHRPPLLFWRATACSGPQECLSNPASAAEIQPLFQAGKHIQRLGSEDLQTALNVEHHTMSKSTLRVGFVTPMQGCVLASPAG